MKTNTPYNLTFETLKLFSMANRLSIRLGKDCISDISILAGLILLHDSSINRQLIKLKHTNDEITQACIDFLTENSEYLNSQTAFKEVQFLDFASNTSFILSNEAYCLLIRANSIATQTFKTDEIGYNMIFQAITELIPNNYFSFIQLTKAIPVARNPITISQNNFVDLKIPPEIANCITILNNDYSPNETYCRILGREKETKQLTAILAKNTKRNAVLVGEPGVGKSAIIDKLTWEVVTGNAPKYFEDSIFLLLDINSMIAGTKFRGEAEKRFEVLVRFIEEHPECVLCIDEIHTMLGAGACVEGEMDMANALKPLLARGSAQVIGATTQKEYEKYFSKDGALKRRFERIDVAEPRATEVADMIKNQVRHLTESHDVTISQDLIEKIIFLATCLMNETKNPDRTLDLIDKSMAIAKLNNQSCVTLENIEENFTENKKKYEKTPLKFRKAITHHEVGHLVVGFFSPLLLNLNFLAVSIMPGIGYYGITVAERDPDIMVLQSRDYFIQYLGYSLAGRVAEEMYLHELTSGAKGDLIEATNLAETMVVSYGLAENFTRNRVYVDGKNNPFFTEKIVNKANPEVNKLLKEAEKYAQKLLKEKKPYVDALVDALFEKKMMSIEEIKDLFKEVDKKHESKNKFWSKI